GGGIDQHRTAHFTAPVIVLGDAAQARLDAANHDGAILPGFAAALAVDDNRAIRPLAAFATRRVGVVTANAQVGGVAIDERVHIAGGHAEEEIRFAELHEVRCAAPVRLCNDADAKTLRFQEAADHRHAEAGVIYIGVAGDDDDVAAVPAK